MRLLCLPPLTSKSTLVWFTVQKRVELEKDMPPHSRILAWKIPWTEGPDGLQSMGVTNSQAQLRD